MSELKFTAQEVAALFGGEVVGDASVVLTDFGKIESGTEGQLSFLSNMKYEHFLYETKCSAVLVRRGFVPSKEISTTLILVEDPYIALAKLLEIKEAAIRPKPGVDALAYVAEDAEIAEDAYVAPFAYIGARVKVGSGSIVHTHAVLSAGVEIGKECTVFPHVTIYPDCGVGNRCIIHSGAVIGADGFGFAPSAEGYSKVPQLGNVVLEDDVEIGANTCIDRAVMGSTVIQRGVKLDNLVQIGHNTTIGENTVIAAQSGVAGSVKVGQWNVFAGQVGVAGHTTTADRVTLAAQTGVISNIKEEGVTLFGSPAQPAKSAMRSAFLYSKLPEINKEIMQLRKELDELRNEIAKSKQ